LLDAVRAAYGIETGSGPVDLGGSSNLNLLLTGASGRWVARVYRPYVMAERLEAIHAARQELTRAGVPCGGPLETKAGQAWTTFEGRLVEVEPYVERDAEMDTWPALETGLPLLARIHAVLSGFPAGEVARRPLFANAIDAAQALPQTLRGAQRIRSWNLAPAALELADEAEALARRVASAELPLRSGLPTGLVHGDFWDDNVFLREGRVVFVADFDFMGESARIDDLALTLYFTCLEFLKEPITGQQLARLRRMLDAYDRGADRPLTTAERAALPLAMARQPLWSIGGWVALLDDEVAARAHAAAAHPEVRWALRLMDDLARWQDAFLG
jgi:homoserine kinase type II